MARQQLNTFLSNETAAMARRVMEATQADETRRNKILMEDLGKREALVNESERWLAEEKEALVSESVALEQMEKDLKARTALLEKKEKKIAFEERELAKEQCRIALEKMDLAKEKRKMASEKAELAKEERKIASEKQALTKEKTELANKTRDERELLKDKEEKLNRREAQLKEGKRTLLAQEQQLIEERAQWQNRIKSESEDLELRGKIRDLDIECNNRNLEEEKEKFLKWKEEEESTLQKQKEQLNLQDKMSAKRNPIEELASRGWMSIEDFFGDVARLKSTLNVSQSTIASMKKLLDHLQSRQKIVDGLIKLDQNAICITIGKLAENGSTAPLFCEGSPDGLDSTLRKLFNSILINARQPASGGTSVISLSFS